MTYPTLLQQTNSYSPRRRLIASNLLRARHPYATTDRTLNRGVYGDAFGAPVQDFAPYIEAIMEAHDTPRAYAERRQASQDAVDYIKRQHRQVQHYLCNTIQNHKDVGDWDNYPVMPSCGHVEEREDTTSDHNGEDYCESCAEALVMIDDEYYHRDHVYYWESDGAYHTEEEPEDYDSDEDQSNALVSWGTGVDHILDHDKSFVPSATGDFTMGVELETETSERHRYHDAIDDTQAYFGKYACLKQDGSLGGNGFEIVTAARRLDDHIARFKQWEPARGMQAWNAGNCGMHVHIDSRAFTSLTLGKFLMLFNLSANAQFIRGIAGRHPLQDKQAKDYAAQDTCTPQDTPVTVKGSTFTSRYRIVNLTNLTGAESNRLNVDVDRDCKGAYSTVEVRIFRATLNKARLLAQIEFTHAAVMFCRVTPWHQMNGDAFKSWLETVAPRYKHLARWFGINLPKVNKKNDPQRSVLTASTEPVSTTEV